MRLPRLLKTVARVLILWAIYIVCVRYLYTAFRPRVRTYLNDVLTSGHTSIPFQQDIDESNLPEKDSIVDRVVAEIVTEEKLGGNINQNSEEIPKFDSSKTLLPEDRKVKIKDLPDELINGHPRTVAKVITSNTSLDLLFVKVKDKFTRLLPTKFSFSKFTVDKILEDTNTAEKLLSANGKLRIFCMSNNFGQLGNKIFQFAATYGLSVNLGMVPMMDSYVYARLADRFKLSGSMNSLVIDRLKLCKPLKLKVKDTKHSTFDNRFVQGLKDQPIYDVFGFFQSWMYFYNIADEIREHLTFRDEYVNLAQEALHQATDLVKTRLQKLGMTTADKGGDTMPNIEYTYVGIHVRRGSLANAHYSEYGHVIADPEYFKRAMTHFHTRYNRVIFIACTNDPDWVLEYVNHPNLVAVQGTINDLDLCILSQCNHTIMSVGTYGWWGAFLANGETVYLTTPAKAGSGYSHTFSTHRTDFYPPFWTPL